MTDVEPQIDRVLEAYRAAVFARDADALMRLYDVDVRVFDAWGVWLYEGATAWRRAIEGWFGSLNKERVAVSFADVRIVGAESVVAVSAIVTYAAESADGEPLRSMQNRVTWVLRREQEGFRIAHEHTSAPIGFQDLKAILSRSPAS